VQQVDKLHITDLTWRACQFDFTSSARHITFVKNNIVDSMSCLQLCEVCQLAAQERIHLHRGPIVSVVELNQTMELNIDIEYNEEKK
jgi:hypothetical protein